MIATQKKEKIYDADSMMQVCRINGRLVSGFSSWLSVAHEHPKIRVKSSCMRNFKARLRLLSRKHKVRVGIRLDHGAYCLTYLGPR